MILDENYPTFRLQIYIRANKQRKVFLYPRYISNAYLHMPIDDEFSFIQTLSAHLGLEEKNKRPIGTFQITENRLS